MDHDGVSRTVLPGLVLAVLVAVLSLFPAPAVSAGASPAALPGSAAVTGAATPHSEAMVHRAIPGLAHPLQVQSWPCTVLTGPQPTVSPEFVGAEAGSRPAGEPSVGAVSPVQGRAPPATAH